MPGQYSDGQAGANSHPPSAGSYGKNYRQVQGLVEDFQSLALVPVLGSSDSTVDSVTLPRPLYFAEEGKPSGNLNCHPRYLRHTTNAMPNAQYLASQWHLPPGVVTHPLAEAPPGEVTVLNFEGSIVRCQRCRTYINAYVMFTDGGRRWRCNVCAMLNEVNLYSIPMEYFCPLDENGRWRDADQRPELSRGSVEFVAPTVYMVRPPMPPLYFFLIDVSLSAVKSGMVKVAAETIKASLDKLPGFPRTQIGFVTFVSTLHSYNLKSSLTQPQMLVIADLDDPFLPLPDDMLVNLSESRTVVNVLLDSLPLMFENNINVESALGPALKATFMVMSQLGGKLLLFQSTLPSLGLGRLKLRGDDPRIYGTEKEHFLRNTGEQFYKQMSADFSKFQISVNVYAFGERYIDIASLGESSQYTYLELVPVLRTGSIGHLYINPRKEGTVRNSEKLTLLKLADLGPKADGLAGFPDPLALSSENLDPRGAFLLNDGLRFVLWLGKEFVKDLLGPEAAFAADSSKIIVVEQNFVISKRLVSALQSLRQSCPAVYQLCTAVKQGVQPREGTSVLSNLVEDRTAGTSGYADFVVQIYRQVSQKS
ncbi:protein transport protein SEC24 A [Physcomitrium patens]|uniref:protein transport protein SEC24 A n=1 Tax=Physcomitrium patens TaxID=3218 RepID=UPI003CCCFEEF